MMINRDPPKISNSQRVVNGCPPKRLLFPVYWSRSDA